jgi:hypothetical protein
VDYARGRRGVTGFVTHENGWTPKAAPSERLRLSRRHGQVRRRSIRRRFQMPHGIFGVRPARKPFGSTKVLAMHEKAFAIVSR